MRLTNLKPNDSAVANKIENPFIRAHILVLFSTLTMKSYWAYVYERRQKVKNENKEIKRNSTLFAENLGRETDSRDRNSFHRYLTIRA